jgi:hypothetical protein
VTETEIDLLDFLTALEDNLLQFGLFGRPTADVVHGFGDVTLMSISTLQPLYQKAKQFISKVINFLIHETG